MRISSWLDQLHLRARENRWLGYFAIFNRIGLAAGFLPSGFVKIAGERFTSLSNKHPMGHYLEALYHTGYYYSFIGIVQLTAAVLLLIPRTATLGAIIYFPVILNICILSFAVRFEGSLYSAPLMVLANVYLLLWDYHKWKLVLPFNQPGTHVAIPKKENLSNKFPVLFFTSVVAIVFLVELVIINAYKIIPRNTLRDCREQCKSSNKSSACYDFCDCIHQSGQPLDTCLDQYNKAPEDTIRMQ